MSVAKLSSNDLLSCPFCGEAPSVSDQHSDEVKRQDGEARKRGHIVPNCYVSWNIHHISASCRQCRIKFDESLTDAMGDEITPQAVSEAREKLKTKWNTRKDNPTGQEPEGFPAQDCSED